MQFHTRGYADRAASTAQAGTPIPFIASTGGVGRDGMIIEQSGWELDNYRKNPVILWAHDYMGQNLPIGRADNLRVEKGQLLCDVTFDQEDEFARAIESKVRRGIINASSVGWETKEMAVSQGGDTPPRALVSELLDISMVPVPGDADALAQRQKRAYRDMGKELLAIADAKDDEDESETPAPKPETPAKPAARATWEETSAAMAGLFRPFAQRPDAQRQTEHAKLARDYARHKKTAPEFLTQEALDALSADEIRGLFLEGEPELHAGLFSAMEIRAGAVLSQRNLDDLKQIVSLANGIIERASKDTQKNADAEDERGTLDALALLQQALSKGTK